MAAGQAPGVRWLLAAVLLLQLLVVYVGWQAFSGGVGDAMQGPECYVGVRQLPPSASPSATSLPSPTSMAVAQVVEGVPVAEHEAVVGQLLAKYRVMAAAYKQHFVAETEPAARVLSKRPARWSSAACPTDTGGEVLTVASFNLWNVNERWRERVAALQQVVDGVDVLAMQEVRSIGGKGRSFPLLQVHRHEAGEEAGAWLADLQLAAVVEALPQYAHVVFAAAAKVEGEVEGLAILSKYPIAQATVQALDTGKRSSDLNTRALLAARIRLDNGALVDVANTHLTYDDHLQCDMVPLAGQVLHDLRAAGQPATQVLVGDMNTYVDFEWPIDFLTEPEAWSMADFNPCASAFAAYPHGRGAMQDVWHAVHPRRPDGTLVHGAGLGDDIEAIGHTFPTFKTHAQDDCRPDRILVTRPCSEGQTEDCGSCHVCAASLWAHEPYDDRGSVLSDHRGLRVMLSCSG